MNNCQLKLRRAPYRPGRAALNKSYQEPQVRGSVGRDSN
jgi:hypothetical protein